MKIRKYSCIILLLIIVFSSCSDSALTNSSSNIEVSSSIEVANNTAQSLATGWHASKSVGAGYSTRYLFNTDESFYYAASEIDSTDRLCYMEGTWRYENNTIILIVTKKIIVEGGVYSKIELGENEYEDLVLTIEGLQDEDVDYGNGKRKTILIENVQFWDIGFGNCSDIPDSWNIYS